MDFWPSPGGIVNPGDLANPFQVNGLTASNGGKSSWVQANYSGSTNPTTDPYDGFWLHFEGSGAFNRGRFLIDVGIGESGSQTVLLANLLHNTGEMIYVSSSPYNGTYPDHRSHAGFWPIPIPAGTKIWYRAQASATTHSGIGVRLFGWRGNVGLWSPGGGVIDTIGADTGNTKGTDASTLGSAWTWGAWSQMTASTASDYCGIAIRAVTVHSAADWDQGDRNGWTRIRLGVGGAGSEVEVAFWENSYAATLSSPFHWLPVNIPAGSRLSVSVQHSSTDNPAVTTVIAYGLRGA